MSATAFDAVQEMLRETPKRWLVTGCAGFIGSHLIETLLSLGQTVVGLDNFATGHRHNLEDVRACVGEDAWQRFTFIHGDIRDLADCRQAVEGVDHVLHEAALGSVPRSIEDPIATNRSNIDGFLNMLVAARHAEVSSFTYAASSSTYGDSQELPKVEERIGRPLSPYAVTKVVNELYADVFQRSYGFDRSKIANKRIRNQMLVTSAQVDYEFKHLLAKLEERAPELFRRLKATQKIDVHPIFRKVRGAVAEWENS